MKSVYKQMCTLAAMICVSAGALAQTATVSPKEGTLSLEVNPAGCAGITLNYSGGATINRDAEGFICLYYGDELLRKIPAGNFKSLYVFDGYNKYTERGEVQVSFFSDYRSAVTNKKGDYTVTIPGGFFYCGATNTPNKPQVLKYTMPSDSDITGFTFLPEPGQVTNLSMITVNCPGEVVAVQSEPYKVSWDVTNDDGTKETITQVMKPFCLHLNLPTSENLLMPTKVDYSGNQVFAYYDAEQMGNYTYFLDIPKECITYLVGENEVKSADLLESYTLRLPTRGEWDLPIYPAEGTVANFPVFETGYASVPSANFYVDVPDGFNVLPQRAYLYRVLEDGTTEKMSTTFSPKKGESNGDGTYRAYFIAYPNGDVNVPAGDYELSIGAKTFYKGSNYSPEITYYYTITGAPIEYTVNPAEGSDLYSVGSFAVTYPDAVVAVSQNDYDPSDYRKGHPVCYATLSNGKAEYFASVTADESDPSTVHYTVMGLPISEAGTWHFKSPAECLTVNGSIPATEFDFVVLNPEVVPAAGSQLTAVHTFTLTAEGTDFAVAADKEAAVYSLDEYGLRIERVASLACNAADVEGSIVVAPADGNDLALVAGKYLLVTPVDLFTCSLGSAGYYEYPFEVVADELAEKPEINPAEGVVESVPEEFVLTVPGAEVKAVDSSLMSIVYYADEDGAPEGMGILYYTAEMGTEPGTVVLKLKSGESPFEKGDNFVLEVPANLFTTTDGTMIKSRYNYTLGEEVAVELVEASAEGYTVYTTTGIRVLSGAKTLSSLPRGLYIVNGKKTVLK